MTDKRSTVRKTVSIKSLGQALEEWQEKIIGWQTGQAFTGLETGFPHLDNLINGLVGIIVVGGGTSGGKTTLFGQLAYQVAAKNGVPVLLFSLEQRVEDILVRILSGISGVVNRDIARGSLGPFSPEASELDKAFDTLKPFAGLLYISGPEGGFRFDRVADIARHAMREHDADRCLVMIDSLHDIAINGRYSNETQRLNMVCRGVVKLAADIGSPVIVTSEINRQSYERAETREQALRCFRDSGRIEFCADLAMILECREGTFNWNPRDMRLRVLKNRMGETGNVYFQFFTNISTFRETDTVWPNEND